jgi:hypothetical protein
VTNVLDEEIKKGLLRIFKEIMAMIVLTFSPSGTMISMWVSQQRVKIELAGLTLIQETS